MVRLPVLHALVLVPLVLLVHAEAQQAPLPPPPAPAAADFRLSVEPSSLKVRRGSSGGVTVNVTPLGGFKGEVVLVSSLLYDTKTSFSPAAVSGGGSSALAIAPAKSAIAGDYALTITGIDGGVSHTITLQVTVK